MEWKSWPASLVDPSARVTLLNAYVACSQTSVWEIIKAAVTDKALSRLESESWSAMQRAVRQQTRGGGTPLRIAEPSEIGRMIAAKSEEEAAILLKSLLRVLAHHTGDALRREKQYLCEAISAGPQFGGAAFYITPDFPGPFRVKLAGKRLPKEDEDIELTPATLHKGVEIIPQQVGSYQLVRVLYPDPKAGALLGIRAQSGTLKIAVSPLTCDATLAGRALEGFPSDQPSRFLLDSVGDESIQLEYLRRLLTCCREDGISILVLPELRMPPNFVQSVAEFLRNQAWSDLKNGRGLLLVAAGSWHVRDASGQKWVNRAQILDFMGRRIWEHDKLARYHVTPENLVGAAGELLRKRFGMNEGGGVEGIEVGHELQFCDTSIGRIASAICVGYFHKPLEELLTRSRAEIFLVPAMSPKTGDLVQRAGELVRSQRAATFVANCGTTGATLGASFYQTSLRLGAVMMESGSEAQSLTFHFQFTDA